MTKLSKGLLIYAINNELANTVGEMLRAKPPVNVVALKYNGIWLEEKFDELYDELWDLNGREPPELRYEIAQYMKRKKRLDRRKSKRDRS